MRINLPSGVTVELKDKITWGDKRRLFAANPTSEVGAPVDPAKINAWQMFAITSVVQSWSLEAPLEAKSFEDLLSPEDGEALTAAVFELYGLREKKEG